MKAEEALLTARDLAGGETFSARREASTDVRPPASSPSYARTKVGGLQKSLLLYRGMSLQKPPSLPPEKLRDKSISAADGTASTGLLQFQPKYWKLPGVIRRLFRRNKNKCAQMGVFAGGL